MDSSCNKMINILVHASFINMSNYDMSVFCISARFVTLCSLGCFKETAKYIFLSNFKERTIQISTKTYFFFTSLFERLLNKLAQLKKNYNILVCTCTWHSSDFLSLFQNSFLKKRKTGTLCVEQVWYYVCNCSVVVA